MLGMVRGRQVIALGLVTAALAFGAAACGDDDEETSGGGQTTTEQTTTSEDTATEEGTTTGDDGASGATLEGETGPGFEIEVRQDGTDVETLSAGTYTISVEDKSEMHNFHLIGPGVDEEVTDVPFVGEKSVEVTLQAGTYTYQCDPHAAQGMKGTFTVS